MQEAKTVIKGVLTTSNGRACVLTADGTKHFEEMMIWDGYLEHWQDREVCARMLQEKDYTTGLPIILVWPDAPPSPSPFFELYYNERLVMYPISCCGHIAINVNDKVFNYSQALNENEMMTPEEYFYRPALGPFAPANPTGPGKQRVNLLDKERPYYDKFGRLFMRSVHVLRVEGQKPFWEKTTDQLATLYHQKIKHILETPVQPDKPDVYTDFRLFRESCTTIIRDGLRLVGFRGIKGILPRDLFTSVAAYFLQQEQQGGLKVT